MNVFQIHEEFDIPFRRDSEDTNMGGDLERRDSEPKASGSKLVDQEQALEREGFSDPNSEFRLNNFKDNYDKAVEEQASNQVWVRLGVVKRLLIYPVDRGTGLVEKSVICTNTGPEFDSTKPEIRGVKDRCLVLYSDRKDSIYLKPEKVMINYNKKMRFYYGDVPADIRDNTIEVINRYYDAWIVRLHIREPTDEHCRELIQTYQKQNRHFRIGYFRPEDRTELNNLLKYTDENFSMNGLNSNYSRYTLVNTKSVEALRKKYEEQMGTENHKTNSKHITYFNFFPHIVVEGDLHSAYKEDHATGIKIGNVVFDTVLPCSHNEEDLKLNPTNGRKPFKHLFQVLIDERLISKTHDHLSHDDAITAVFGMNMEKVRSNAMDDDSNRISENDVVYVRYDLPKSPAVVRTS